MSAVAQLAETTSREAKEHFLALWSEWEKRRSEALPSWLRRQKKAAIARFSELGFPGARNEDWRFTNLAPVLKGRFNLAGSPGKGASKHVAIDELIPATPEAAVYVFVNGQLVIPAADKSLPSGVVVTDLANALLTHENLVSQYLGRLARFENHPFVALNTALFDNGAFVFVPAGVELATPIHLVFCSATSAGPTLITPRSLLVCEARSQAAIVETYVGPAKHDYLSAAVTEVVVGAEAQVRHGKYQIENRSAFHFGSHFVSLAATSQFSSQAVNQGGALVRNDIAAVFEAPDSECTLNGLTFADGTQHVVNHTTIDHAQPQCRSHEMYKNVINGQARVVFNGKIFVRKHAQKTDAKQSNQSLLLSDDATVHTKPQLEIFADDVKCTHGATVGQLEEAALFYCRARGMSLEQARSMLTAAFANEILQQIPLASLRANLESQVLKS